MTSIYKYIHPEKAFYLLRVKPQITTEITVKLESLEGVQRVLETFGLYDVLVEANLYEDLQRKIEELLGTDIIEIYPLIVG